MPHMVDGAGLVNAQSFEGVALLSYHYYRPVPYVSRTFPDWN